MLLGCGMHPGACRGTLMHSEEGDDVLDNEGSPPDLLYVAVSTVVTDSLPALMGVLPGNEFIG